MAIIRGAYGGGQIKGSIAGVTFQQGPYGTVARNRTVPVNPNSPGQVGIRGAMAQMSNYWSNTLTSAQRKAWDDYAAQTPLPDRFGQNVPTKGRQMFLRYANAAVYLGGTPIATAPSTPGVAASPSVIYGGIQTVGLTVDTINSTLVGADAILFRVGQPVGGARNFYKAPFFLRGAAISTTTLPLVLLTPAQCVVGQRYFVAARRFDADGKVSFEVITPVDIV